ncbi:MAG: Mfa1 family fimbria major subunit [Prevotella sp.]|jgi:hypothetical protein|nr:Mfa1 family fimbria major subunit [Prevotella sp.]MDR2001485.1 Mfa1 family fimbria major subunit [Prevotella sp.]
MKRNVWYFLTLALLLGLGSCDNEKEETRETDEFNKGTTFMGITIFLPQKNLKASDDQNYNVAGSYSGITNILSLDLYLLSEDGTILLDSRRFDDGDLTVNTDPSGRDHIRLVAPFKTTSGDKKMIVIVNNPQPLLSSVPSDDYLYTLSSSLPLNDLARIGSAVTTPDGPAYIDILVMTGKSNTFTIQDDVSAQEVISSGKNTIDLGVVRIPSRVIITKTTSSDIIDSNGTKLGTISDLTYSVAQGANAIYMFPQTNSDGTTKTWGYDYLPGVGTDYYSTAGTYYDYSDINNTTDAIPDKSGNYIIFPGKFFLENTHLAGVNASNSLYRKGNTAYVLIRGVFTPDPSRIKDGDSLTDGTFYVGGTDGAIYSSMEKALDNNVGTVNQSVATYTNGKVLYFAWLNPDNIQKPINSPAIRNNIYHININSFKSIGVNWNPLVPDGSNVAHNPDPKPGPHEPANPIDPNDPLSLNDTYMSVDVTVLMWTVHTYDIDL